MILVKIVERERSPSWPFVFFWIHLILIHGVDEAVKPRWFTALHRICSNRLLISVSIFVAGSQLDIVIILLQVANEDVW